MAGSTEATSSSKKQPCYLGVEIGGTKLQIGLGADGHLESLWRSTVDIKAGAEGIRQQLLQGIPVVLTTAGRDRSEVQRLGIGFGGPVEDKRQRVLLSHQIQGWDDFPLADWFTEVVGLPAVLGNDADVAGLAEALYGAGKGRSPVFYVTIGSGIGGGLIIDDTIYRGIGVGAAEIGHLRMLAPATGTWVPLEQLASGWALGRRASQRLRHKRSEQDTHTWTAQEVGELAWRGDPDALALLEETWTYLAEALCHVIALVCPRRIVLGGGVSLLGEELLFTPLRRLVRQRVFAPFADLTEIVPGELGEEVVVHGAIALASRPRALA